MELGWNEAYVIVKQREDKENHWIIKVDTEKAIGPLNYNALVKEREAVGISKQIDFKSIDFKNEIYFRWWMLRF
ncbi:hypothetical protein CAI16_14690 [Virgibacillus dokdonensis]|uniref:Uncharacterized protein n=1 Tax=Virgibacillus dokdonensis TaxID=302167 RepID=A0A3E0WKB2_9BACI|nr:hypothetical protein [Virgibacillus dokdonensis]RFA33392.1 hypothetical protein CAI16_14690 [Virgibacillus dokdonensis]